MPTYVLFFLVGAGLGLVALQGRRRRPAARHASVTALRPVVGQRVLSRVGRVGDLEQPAPLRAIADVAPIDRPAEALVVQTSDGAAPLAVRVADVAVARAWSAGELVAAFGIALGAHGPTWAMSSNLAGWELQVVTDDGDVVRCYGAPGQRLATDLERLRRRLVTLELAKAG